MAGRQLVEQLSGALGLRKFNGLEFLRGIQFLHIFPFRALAFPRVTVCKDIILNRSTGSERLI